MLYAFCFACVIIAIVCIIRYISLIQSLKKIEQEIHWIEQDILHKPMLHLPSPNRHLSSLLSTLNHLFDTIHADYIDYQAREKTFQAQIEHISHDLRTPLTVILGYLQLLKQTKTAISQDERQETLSIVEKKALQLQQLMEQFYDFSRITAGEYPLDLEAVDIAQLARELILEHYQEFESQQLAVQIKIPSFPVTILGNTIALERIVSNLLHNASYYAQHFFTVRLEIKEQTALLTFINDTNQLTSKEVPHLFQRFYQANATRESNRTGLGLTVAQTLAEELGGHLSVSILKEQADCLHLAFQLTFPLLPSFSPFLSKK